MKKRQRAVLIGAVVLCVVTLIGALITLHHSAGSFSKAVSGLSSAASHASSSSSLASTPSSANIYKGHIAQIHSRNDTNHNGVDDQIDILRGARAYAATQPEYKSEYYQGGYPTDHKGVCTDLVAAAFKYAGFNLRDLVDADIRSNPGNYDIVAPDPNIDYRRVMNLTVFFHDWAAQGKATALTTNIHDIRAWQGGDVVIFRNHIGIISDKRDAAGIPYVIHHNYRGQTNFEEDVLPHRHDIAAHYRVR